MLDLIAKLSNANGATSHFLSPPETKAAWQNKRQRDSINIGAHPVLVERDQPLESLLNVAARAQDGRGGVVLVGGEAGIGKTSLLEEMRLTLAGTCTVMWGGCDPLHTPRPLGPVHDMSYALGPEVTAILNEKTSTPQLFAAIFAQLEHAKDVTILVIEDAHWADHATLDLIRFLARRVPFVRAVLVISFRHDEIDSSHPLSQVLGDLPHAYTTRVSLEPLTVEGVKALASAAGRIDEDLHKITGGNPFFVSELLANSTSLSSVVPPSIRDAIGSRLNRIGNAEREFLETICLIPNAIDGHLLRELFDDQGDTLAMACVGRNLLTMSADGSFRFRHELARLGTLSRVPVTAQKDIHARVLAALLKAPHKAKLEQLVHHAAGAFDVKRVHEFAPAAATAAASVGAHREAAAHLATALRFVDEASPEMAANLYERWAYEAGLVRIDDEVIEARRHAISLWRALDRADKIGENLRWLSRLHWYRGEAAEANHFADEAVRVLEKTPPSVERAMAFSLRSQLHMLNDRMDEAVIWGKRALAMAEAFDSVEVRIHALNNIGTSLVFRDKPEGQSYLEESLALATEHGFHEHAARVYTNLAEYGVEYRDYALAEKIINEGIAFDTHHDLDTWTHYLIGRLAQLRLGQGRLRDAETIAQGVLNLDRLTLLMRLPALIVLARTHLRLAQVDAHELLARAMRDAMATDEVQHIIPARLNLIEAAWLNNDSEAATEHLNSLANMDANCMHPWSAGELSVWMQRFGDERLIDYPLKIPKPHALELNGNYAAAADAWERLQDPYSAALSLMQIQGDEAGPALTRALKLLEPIEALAAAAKVRAQYLALGYTKKLPRRRRGPYKTARKHPLGLTKREQEILRFMTEGSSNREISTALSRSQRTIEHHVSSILAKLSVENRMEAMLRVHNEPWLMPENESTKK